MKAKDVKTINNINEKKEWKKVKKLFQKLKKFSEDEIVNDIMILIDDFKTENDFIKMELVINSMHKCGFSDNFCMTVSIYNFMAFCKFSENN